MSEEYTNLRPLIEAEWQKQRGAFWVQYRAWKEELARQKAEDTAFELSVGFALSVVAVFCVMVTFSWL